MLSRGTFILATNCHEICHAFSWVVVKDGVETYDIIYKSPHLGSIGAVAQLVERFAGSEKVREFDSPQLHQKS